MDVLNDAKSITFEYEDFMNIAVRKTADLAAGTYIPQLAKDAIKRNIPVILKNSIEGKEYKLSLEEEEWKISG
jgi:hypothetical protein